ncbi:MAG: carnitine dehydratase [Salinisphaeraceae bacterium]|nr:carnitine dehydratase [Salinisphaeraceae bacterium]
MTNPLLNGVRILDLTRLLPGPFCTQYLAQLGAEVIKIEDPDGGDYARALSPELFAVVNRGKQSVTLDLRQAEDVERFYALVAQADVVVESFRPGVMDRLGCGYDRLKTLKPALVYVALTGYGQSGPLREAAGHDLNYLALSGALDQIGAAGGAPAMNNLQVADLAGGALTCAVGLLAALFGARASGQGSFVDSAMLDGSLALQPMALATLRSQGRTQPRGSDMLTGALPNYRSYKCRDGRYLAVGALEPKFFLRLVRALQQTIPIPGLRGGGGGGASSSRAADKSSATKAVPGRLDKLMDDPARARRWLRPIHWGLASLFRLRSRDYWLKVLADADACTTPVLKLEEALGSQQIIERGLRESAGGQTAFACPIMLDGQRPAPLADAPELGADNGLLHTLS